MLVRMYQFLGLGVLSAYAWSSLMGWEFVNPVLVRPAPPIGALVGSSSSGWSGRSATYRSGGGSSSSGTRSGWGGGGFGGK